MTAASEPPTSAPAASPGVHWHAGRASRAGRAALRVLGTVIPVMLGVVTAVFFLLRLVPGDPAVMILGDRATPAQLAELREKLGLNEPLWRQYLDFVWGVISRGDTGNSLVTGVPTAELVAARAPVSLGIVLLALVFVIAIAVPLALAAARRPGGWVDQLVRILPTITLGMPLFWVGLLLIIVFAVNLGWFPVGGVAPAGSAPLEPLRSLALPALAVSLGMAPPIIRSLRAQLIEVTEAEFVTTLRAARVSERRIRWRHVLRGAALPTLNLLSVNFAFMIGGTLVVEKVFGINGLGTLLFQSISSRDFPVVQAVALYCAVLVVIVTLAAQVLSALVDPRLRGTATSHANGGSL